LRAKLRELGVVPRDTRGESARKRLTTWTPEKLAELAEKLAQAPVATVAREYGLTHGGLADVIHRYEVPTRGRSRQQTPEEIERRIAPLRGREKVDWGVPRECRVCHEVKQPDEFPHDRNQGSRRCLACRADARNARWHEAPPERKRAITDQLVLRKYKLTAEEFEAKLAEQGGSCALCGIPSNGDKMRWSVDHDHACCSGQRTCGQCNRGIVCQRCNLMIGWYETIQREGAAKRIEDYLDAYTA